MKLVELEENIFELPTFLSHEECESLIKIGESIGFKAADVQTTSGRQLHTHIRNNERADHHSCSLAEAYWQRLVGLELPTYEDKNAIGISPYFRFYKYLPGQKFNMHKDGHQTIGHNETIYTFLVYLNEDCVGGETLFRNGNLKVTPKKGSAVIFEHQLWHQGVEVASGMKYVLRSDVVYG
jgi:hypothetical protein